MKTQGAALLVVLAVAGCGGTGSSDGAVKKAVGAYSQAFLAGDGAAAYGMLSDRCRGAISRDQFAAVASAAKSVYGPQPITSLTVVDAKGAAAHVTYTYAAAKLDQTRQSWVKESGSWRWDGC